MRLHHLGFVGPRLDVLQKRFAAEGGEALGPPVDDPVQRVTVQFYREPGGVLWELVVPLGSSEDSPLRTRLARGGGLDHVCYELDPEDPDLEATVAAERTRGAVVVCAPVQAVAFGRRVAFVYRRSGRLIEFVEPRPSGAPL